MGRSLHDPIKKSLTEQTINKRTRDIKCQVQVQHMETKYIVKAKESRDDNSAKATWAATFGLFLFG